MLYARYCTGASYAILGVSGDCRSILDLLGTQSFPRPLHTPPAPRHSRLELNVSYFPESSTTESTHLLARCCLKQRRSGLRGTLCRSLLSTATSTAFLLSRPLAIVDAIKAHRASFYTTAVFAPFSLPFPSTTTTVINPHATALLKDKCAHQYRIRRAWRKTLRRLPRQRIAVKMR